jgi:hypothetical protein
MEKINQLDNNRIPEDCMQCRIIGTLSFTGISGYAAYLRLNTPRNDKGQRLFLLGFSLTALGVAGWRAIVD